MEKQTATTSRASIFVFALACLAAFLLELAAEHLMVDSDARSGTEASSPLAEPLFGLSGLYQRLVTAGPRKPVQKFTILVDTHADGDSYYASLTDSVLNVCERRTALADLLRRIAAAEPAVIVLDYTFHPSQCRANSAETRYLQKIVGDISTRMPVVIGRRIDVHARRLEPTVAFPAAPGQLLRHGAIEFDPDTKRLPLKWVVHPESAHTGPGRQWESIDTLALAAAKAFDPDLVTKYRRLGNFLKGNRTLFGDAIHPYISFLKTSQLTIHPAGAILCGRNYAKADAATTAKACEQTPSVLAALRGKIVLVGASDESDQHLSAIGEVPGFILQANYIEALLDERYFSPAPKLLDYTMGFLIFFAIVYAAHFGNPSKTALWWVASMGIAYVVISFFIMQLGLYVNPVTASVLALIFNFSHLVISTADRLGSTALSRIHNRRRTS